MFFFFNQEELKDYYLTYFDILGYKSYFDNEKNDPYDFLSVIKQALEDVKKGVNIAHSLNKVDIGFRVYSDNFLFYIEEQNNELQAMATFTYLISLIQKRLLENYSLLIRGGITKGKFYFNDDLLFGKGLIDVYTLESKYAIYPRVIIDRNEGVFSKQTIEVLTDSGEIAKDSDDYYYIQYLSALGKDDDLKTLSNNIKKLVNINCRYRNMTDPSKIVEKEKLISKYLWLVTRYNSYCDRHTKIDCKISFTTEINPKVLKAEVLCK